jgi:hypothetical protein
MEKSNPITCAASVILAKTKQRKVTQQAKIRPIWPPWLPCLRWRSSDFLQGIFLKTICRTSKTCLYHNKIYLHEKWFWCRSVSHDTAQPD